MEMGSPTVPISWTVCVAKPGETAIKLLSVVTICPVMTPAVHEVQRIETYERTQPFRGEMQERKLRVRSAK